MIGVLAHMSLPTFVSVVCVAQSLVFYVVFYRSLFAISLFFFWSLYCLSFDLDVS